MITVKTKTSKYLIIVAVFVISLTAIYFIKNKNKNNNVNGKSSSEIKLSFVKCVKREIDAVCGRSVVEFVKIVVKLDKAKGSSKRKKVRAG